MKFCDIIPQPKVDDVIVPKVGIEEECVVSQSPGEGIVASTSDQNVFVCTATQHVLSEAPIEDVLRRSSSWGAYSVRAICAAEVYLPAIQDSHSEHRCCLAAMP